MMFRRWPCRLWTVCLMALFAAPAPLSAEPPVDPESDETGFVPLGNGRDLTGFTPRGGGRWGFEDGVLVGRDGPGHLFTDAKHTDFELRTSVKVNARGNSGIYFRTVPRKEDPNTWPLGYEAQVDNHDPKNFTGCIYDRAWPADREGGAKKPVTRDNEWFDYRIRAEGDRLRTWINGQLMTDARLGEFKEGHFAFQTHHVGNEILFRDLRVKRLDAPAPSASRGKGPVRVFYCTHSAGYRHEVLPLTRELLAKWAEEDDRLSVVVSDSIADLTPERLAETDIVMLYTTGSLPMGEMKRRLLTWVAEGGAIVGVHSATDTFAESPEYVRTIGGTFESHPWNSLVTIRVDDPSHPAMRAFIAPTGEARPGATFTIADEIYQFRSLSPDLHVLMSLDPATPGSDPARKYPLAWTQQVGEGRVFYTALGHRPEVWQDERFKEHLLAGIRWAAGTEAMSE